MPRYREIVLLIAALLGGCGIFAGDKKAYDGPVMPDAEIATIDNSGSIFYGDWTGALRRVAGNGRVYYEHSRDGIIDEIELLPGTYEVSYAHKHRHTTGRGYRDTIDLAAGHTYKIKTDVCYTLCSDMPSYHTFLWIEDTKTGQVVSGEAP